MSVVVSEIKRREEQLNTYDEKVEKRFRLRAELEQLDKEIENTDILLIKQEIDELTKDAIALGYIDIEKDKSEDSTSTDECIDEQQDPAERAASVFTTSV